MLGRVRLAPLYEATRALVLTKDLINDLAVSLSTLPPKTWAILHATSNKLRAMLPVRDGIRYRSDLCKRSCSNKKLDFRALKASSALCPPRQRPGSARLTDITVNGNELSPGLSMLIRRLPK